MNFDSDFERTIICWRLHQRWEKEAINIIITCNGVSAIFYLLSTFINYFSVGAGVYTRVGGNINLPSPAMLLCGSLLSPDQSIITTQWPLTMSRWGWPWGRGRWGDQVPDRSPGDNLLLGDLLSGVRGEAGRGGHKGHRGMSGARHHPLWWHR